MTWEVALSLRIGTFKNRENFDFFPVSSFRVCDATLHCAYPDTKSNAYCLLELLLLYSHGNNLELLSVTYS